MNNKNTSRSCGLPKPKKCSVRLKKPKPKKHKCRIRNWSDYKIVFYNTALVQRGSLCLWLDKTTLQNWRCQERTKKRGKPKVYSGQAIVCALRLGAVYHLSLRAMEGLLASLVTLAGAEVREWLKQNGSAPHYPNKASY